MFSLANLLGSSLLWQAVTSLSCHPLPNPHQSQYVIGYGSLIYEPSKKTTLRHSGKNQPILLFGYERGWFVRSLSLSEPTTFLGVRPSPKNFKMNAVAFKIQPLKQIFALDKREQGYCRHRLDPKNFKFIRNHTPPNAQFWIYIPKLKVRAYATKKFPMSLYYTYIFISGCLEIQKQYHLPGFAKQCITTTHHWPKYYTHHTIVNHKLHLYIQKSRHLLRHLYPFL